jgi:hypothetical protein
MGNIKAQELNITGLRDQYGNTVPNFKISTATETLAERPLDASASPNLVRPDLYIDSKGPAITGWSPGVGALSGGVYSSAIGTGADLNGGLISANAAGTSITLKYNKSVSAQAGKNIIIRPYGAYAVPPVMSEADFNSLYNSVFYEVDAQENGEYKNLNSVADTVTTTYRRILRDVDANGLPAPTWQEFLRNDYNFYKYTTHGLNEPGALDKNGNPVVYTRNTDTANVRPDLTGKYVLDFRHDLYEGVDRLRNVFNAAHWNWQIISVTNTTYVNVAGDTVTINLTKALDDGRIWEVIIDRGAFRDNAGNDSAALNPGSYRFWSRNTAKPVIRVDRYSSGEHYQGNFNANLNLLDSYGTANMPKIDTRVRIDCETPGASITYDTVRTYVVRDAATNYPNGTSTILTGTWTGYNILPATTNPYGNDNTKNANGFFYNKLLMPDTNQSGGTALANGTMSWTNFKTAAPGSGTAYRTITGTVTTITYGTNVFSTPDVTNINGTGITRTTYGRFIYVGEAFGTTSNTATGENDPKLYTGRRDYVAAIAVKNSVTDNMNTGANANRSFTGPALTGSAPSYEGVYKTTLLYRNTGYNNADETNNNGTRRLLVMGYDAFTPVVSTVPGFPLQDTGLSSPDGNVWTSYFWRQAWRHGANNNTNPNNLTWAATQSAGNTGYQNRYIWNTWDIVCDWYLRGRTIQGSSVTAPSVPGLNPDPANGYWNNAIVATYGAVLYRYGI